MDVERGKRIAELKEYILDERAEKLIKLYEDTIAECLSTHWRCFFCDEVFTTSEAALDHFGSDEGCYSDGPACKLNESEKQLAGMLRQAMDEIKQYQNEETPVYRELYNHGYRNAYADMQAEERGYARGLKDGKFYWSPWQRLWRWYIDRKIPPL